MTRSAELDRKIITLARKHGGIVTWKQLSELGVTTSGVKSRIARGMLRRVTHGVYEVVTADHDAWTRLAQAAVVAVGSRGALSHDSAARVLGLDLPRSDKVEVTVVRPFNVVRVDKPFTVHRSRNLPTWQRVRCGRLLVTSPERTLIDVAPRYSREQLRKALDDAVWRELVRPRRMLTLLNSRNVRSRGGLAVLRELLDVWLEPATPESVPEAELSRIVVEAGLPRPVFRYQVFDKGEFVARLDLSWPELKIAVEVDSSRYHSNSKALHDDRARENKLGALGWIVLRITPKELRESPGPFLKALRDRLLERGAKLP